MISVFALGRVVDGVLRKALTERRAQPKLACRKFENERKAGAGFGSGSSHWRERALLGHIPNCFLNEWLKCAESLKPQYKAISVILLPRMRGSDSSCKQRFKRSVRIQSFTVDPRREKSRCRWRTEMPAADAISAGHSVASVKCWLM